MKIIVLHGDDEKALYERLQKFVSTAKSRSWEVVDINDSDLKFQEVLTVDSLFSKERFFILKDISKVSAKDLLWFKNKGNNSSGNLIIYNEGYLTKKVLDSLPKVDKVEEYKLPKIIFTFLDSFLLGNSRKVLEMLHKLVETEAVERIFAILVKQIKDLYWVKVDSSTIPYPSWRSGKLKSQSSKFTVEKLKEVINDLSEIDVKVKTSKTDLLQSLDLLVMKHLE
ncbi:MAG: hypothetical protein ACHQUA_01020 [Microgenomates group bacterium]